MSLEQRQYQKEDIARLAAVRQEGNSRALVVLASGLGKTVEAALDVQQWLSEHRGRILFLCHQTDILEQALETFRNILGPRRYTYGRLDGNYKEPTAQCLFASFQTMRQFRWLKRFGPAAFGYVIVDESHHGPAPTYQPVITHFSKARFLLGMTATPERTDHQALSALYGSPAIYRPLEDALAQGLLTPVRYVIMKDEIQEAALEALPWGRQGLGILNRRLFLPKRDEELAQIIRRRMARIENPRAMIFCPSIRHADRLAGCFDRAQAIHSRLSLKEQRDRLARFRHGELRLICSVDKFNEGIDIPSANVIVFLRSTASRRIFFQQLGRGLRKHPGKRRVLVLDFVANAQRLMLIQRLRQAVRASLPSRPKQPRPTPISFDIPRIRFIGQRLNIFDVIAGVRGGYTRESLINYLRALTKKLGRTPLLRDIKDEGNAGRGPGLTVFYKYCGSFRMALRLAGFPVRLRHTKELLLNQLCTLAKKLGRPPVLGDIQAACRRGESASPGVFRKHFGSMAHAFTLANLVYRPLVTRHPTAELLNQLRTLAKKLGRPPAQGNIQAASRRGESAGPGAFRARFGTVAKARVAAGLPYGRGRYSATDLIRQLQSLANKLGYRPSCRDIKAAYRRGESAGPGAFRARFGTMKKAWAATHLSFPPKSQKRPSDADLITTLCVTAKRLGRTPLMTDIHRLHTAGLAPGPDLFRKRFGSWTNAVIRAGLSARPPQRHCSTTELLEELCTLRGELGRLPSISDLKRASKLGQYASTSMFQKKFGSWTNALAAAERHRRRSHSASK